jgi:hypothetical protein
MKPAAIAARYFEDPEQEKELVMKRLIGAAVVAAVLALAAPAALNPAAAASPLVTTQTAGTSDSTDFSARRHYRRYYRPYYQPYYYARPTYYRPYPYLLPAPFPLGIGFGPFWW